MPLFSCFPLLLISLKSAAVVVKHEYWCFVVLEDREKYGLLCSVVVNSDGELASLHLTRTSPR